MNLDAHLQRIIAPFESHLFHSIIFADAPSTLLLTSLPGPATTLDRRGVDYLIGSLGVRNMIEMDTAWSQLEGNGRSTGSDAISSIPISAQAVPSESSTAEKSESLDDSIGGWNNDIDFLDADDAAEEAVEEEKKVSIPATKATTTVVADVTPVSLIPPRPSSLTILPIDLSHARVNDADVLQMIAESQPSESVADKTKADDWGWQDEEEDNSKSTAAAKKDAPRAFSSMTTAMPDAPVRATSKVCFFVTGALLTPLLTRVATIAARSRCAPAPFSSAVSSSNECTFVTELHLFTTVSENAHLEHLSIGEGFVALQQQLTRMIRADRSKSPEEAIRNSADSAVKVEIHFCPLSFTALS